MFWSALLASAHFGNGGANIGMGLLMLISPLLVGSLAFGVAAVQHRA